MEKTLYEGKKLYYKEKWWYDLSLKNYDYNKLNRLLENLLEIQENEKSYNVFNVDLSNNIKVVKYLIYRSHNKK